MLWLEVETFVSTKTLSIDKKYVKTYFIGQRVADDLWLAYFRLLVSYGTVNIT